MSQNISDPKSNLSLIGMVGEAMATNQIESFFSAWRYLITELDAKIAILWGCDPDFESLRVLSQCSLSAEEAHFTALPAGESFSGNVYLESLNNPKEERYKYIPNLTQNPRFDEYTECKRWLRDNNINCIYATTVKFPDKTTGVLSLYWEPESVTIPEKTTTLNLHKKLIPALHYITNSPKNLKFIYDFTKIFHRQVAPTQTEHPHKITKNTIEDSKVSATNPTSNLETEQLASNKTLNHISELIVETFDPLTVSIYLSDTNDHKTVFKLKTTSWSRKEQLNSIDPNTQYGFISWVLKNNAPLFINDITKYDSQKTEITKNYPGLTWKKPDDFETQIKQHPRMKNRMIPPLSLVIVPISKDTSKCLGAITCFSAFKKPFFYGSHEVNLLELLSTHMANYWISHLERQDILKENISWRKLNKCISKMNEITHKHMGESHNFEKKLLEDILEKISHVIPEGNMLSIRYINKNNPKDKYLYFKAVFGKKWTMGSQSEIDARMGRRFYLNQAPPQDASKTDPHAQNSMHTRTSAGAIVFKDKETKHVRDKNTDKDYSATFFETEEMIIAPIGVGNNMIGLLDIRTTNPTGFSQHKVTIATLLGQQLGICLMAIRATTELRDSLSKTKNLRQQQTQIFEDFSHQVKTPIIQATGRLSRLITGKVPGFEKAQHLQTTHDLCNKATQVAKRIGFFAELAQGKPLQMHWTQLNLNELLGIIKEEINISRLVIREGRNITITYNKKSFRPLLKRVVKIDTSLFTQAFSNLLDNAVKYSFPDTEIEINGGQDNEYFFIAVHNIGASIRSFELEAVKKRNYRGSATEEISLPEGKGIGLWLANHIMEAHGGSLKIYATTPTHRTQIRLYFPFL